MFPLYDSLPVIIGVAAGVQGKTDLAALVPVMLLATAPQGHCIVQACTESLNPPADREMSWEHEQSALNAAAGSARNEVIALLRAAFTVGSDEAERETLRALVPSEWQALGDFDVGDVRSKRTALLRVAGIKDVDSAKLVTENMAAAAALVSNCWLI